MVFHEGASEDLEIIRELMTRWSRVVAEHRNIVIDTAGSVEDLSKWLLRWVGAAAQLNYAADYLTELDNAIKGAQRTIDRAPDMRCLGPCDVDGCVAWLYVPAGADIARCPSPDCDAEYRVEDRRAWLLEQTVDRLMTAAEIARDLPWIAGTKIDRKLINKWSSRDQLTRYDPHHADKRQSPRFRVGEVIDRIRAETVEKETKRAASGAA